MAVKHDSIVPYIEIGGIHVGAFAFTEELGEDKVDLLISRDTKIDLCDNRFNRYELIKLLEEKPVDIVFGLEGKLTAAEIKELNERKSEIIDYFQNLKKYYNLEDVKHA